MMDLTSLSGFHDIDSIVTDMGRIEATGSEKNVRHVHKLSLCSIYVHI